MTSILLIEDEVEIASDLKKMIEHFGNGFTVCGVLSSVQEAKRWLTSNKSPHLILCDIQLSDGLSFSIFEHLSIKCPVIFCTGHNDHAMEAFENNGIDYLLKPIDVFSLHKSLEKFKRFRDFLSEDFSRDISTLKRAMIARNTFRSSVLVYVKDQIIPINLDNIDFIYYNNYQVSVYAGSMRYETRDTLNNILDTLNPRDFFRANRQFIVHRKAVISIQQYFGRKLLVGVTCTTPEPLIVSKANASDFLKWIEGRHVAQLDN
ncbi:LytR/AlgR family response regulator transcription factor [Dyadobacter crusticola]|uniref:LytR/AlgR family response regulator transcription factor n=1 Tax=Dyadobacter crusticola TaxID=292407 RepID=UPI0004E1B62E|nr:response regulator transcription factor [Dyadobacter crusticola]